MGDRYSGQSVSRRVRRIALGATPAAGADWSVTVPGGFIWRVISAYASLVSSAAAGQRMPRLQISDGVATFLDLPPVNGQQASLTHRYSWLASGSTYQAVAGVPSTVIAGAVATTGAATALSYTVPTGAQAVLRTATFHLIGGTPPTVQLQLVRGATTIVLWSGSADTQLYPELALIAGDVVRWQVTAGGAGSSGDFTISGEPTSLAGTTDGEAITIPELVLEAGWQIKVSTDNLDVGDQWSAPRLYIVEATDVGGPVDLRSESELVTIAGIAAGA